MKDLYTIQQVVMYDIVRIEWVDSRLCSHWQHIEDIDEDVVKCTTIGFLIKETDNAFYVTHTVAKDEQAAGCIIIPRECIKKYEIIRQTELFK